MNRVASAAIVWGVLATPALAAGGGSNPMAGRIYQAIAAVVVFLIVLAVLKRYAWGPVLKGLQDRERRIREDLEQADRAARQAEETLQEYKRHLAEAHEEARQLVEQGRADAERVASQIKQQAQDELEQTRARAHREIEQAKEQAVNEVYEQTVTLAVDVAGKILEREVSAADHQRLVDDAIEKLGAAQRG